jgi:WD40 repeat protein
VRGRTVLTAGHVVEGAHRVLVRDIRKNTMEAVVDPHFIVVSNALDLAMITIDAPDIDLPPVQLALIDRNSATGAPVEECQIVGYPAFMEKPQVGRETAEAYGRVSVLAGLVSGLLTVQLSSSPRPLPPERSRLDESEWSGMSGAPVFAGEYLIGVVSEHAPREGSSSITAVPFELLEPDPRRPRWGEGAPNATEWWARLGVSKRSNLPILPRGLDRPTPAYRATLREIHSRTPHLLGRQAEVAEIRAFATGPAGYLWLTGEMWSGKTALLAEVVVAAAPERTDVVAYFLSRREADAHSGRFLAAIIPQLSYLLDEAPPAVASIELFRDLWHRATARAARLRRKLLLVVDGMDEDIRPQELPSVASLLPGSLGPSGHVLVASRPQHPLPADVPAGHPLRSVEHVPLQAATEAADLSVLAFAELDALIGGADRDVAADVLGLLAVAGGPLTVEDLVALSSAGRATRENWAGRVRQFVTRQAARSLEKVGSATRPSYQFAHESLLATALRTAAPDLPDLRLRFDRWADTWREAGWPVADRTGTPRYLFQAYPTTLPGSTGRLRALAEDIGWVSAAIREVGIDQTLAHLALVGQADPHDRLAVIRAVLRNQAHNLRPGTLLEGAGSVLRQICLGALELGAADIADESRDRLRTQPCPWPVPLATTRRSSPALTVRLGAHTAWVQAIAELPDGRVVSVGDDAQIIAWDKGRAGEQGLRLGQHDTMEMTSVENNIRRITNGGITSVVVLKGGRVVTGGGDGLVRVWNQTNPASDGLILGHHTHDVAGLAVLPDERLVSFGCFGEWEARPGGGMHTSNTERARVWNPAAPDTAEKEFGPVAGYMHAIAVLQDGRVVSSSQGNALLLWDPAADSSRPTLLGWLGSKVVTISVLDDGRVAVGEKAGAITIWNPARPRARTVALGHPAHPEPRVAGLRGGRLVSAGRDGRVLIWDVHRPDARPVLLGRHDSHISALAVLHDETVVTGGRDGRVLAWDPHEAMPIGVDLFDDRERDVAVLPDGRVASLGVDGRVRLWTSVGSQLRPVEVGNYGPDTVAEAVLPGGRIIFDHADGSRTIMGPAPKTQKPSKPLGAADVPGTPDEDLDYNHSPGSRGLPDLNELIREIGQLADDAFVQSIGVLSSGKLLLGGFDGILRVRDPNRPRAKAVNAGRQPGPIEAIAVTPDDSAVTGGYDGSVRLWDLSILADRRRGLATLVRRARRRADYIYVGRHENTVEDVAVLPDGTIASVCRRGTGIRIWDPLHPGDSYELPGSFDVRALSADVHNRAILGADGSIGIWRLDNRDDEPNRLGDNTEGVSAAAGQDLIVSGGANYLKLWDSARRVEIAASAHPVRALAIGPIPSSRAKRLVTAHTGHGLTVWEVAEAGSDFWNSVRSDRGYRDALLSASTRSYRDGRFTRAETLLRHLLELDPQNTVANGNMGYLQLTTRGDPTTASIFLRTALESDPDYISAHVTSGHLSLAIGDRRAARESFERAAQIAPNAEAELFLGALRVSTDDADAERRFRRSLSLVEEQPAATFFRRAENRSLALLGLGQEAEALEALELALSQPSSADVFQPYKYSVFANPQRATALARLYETWKKAIARQPELVGPWGAPPSSKEGQGDSGFADPGGSIS